jgi:hypothetical protein
MNFSIIGTQREIDHLLTVPSEPIQYRRPATIARQTSCALPADPSQTVCDRMASKSSLRQPTLVCLLERAAVGAESELRPMSISS